MILFPHMLAGALIGSKFENLAIIFAAAVCLHFLLDIIPHWDYLENEISEFSKKGFSIFLGKVAIDIILGGFFVWLLFKDFPVPFRNIVWGAFFGILPDGLVFLNQISGKKINWLKKFQAFHHRLHFLLEASKKVPLRTGLLLEILTVVILLILIRL